jgi:hypothetical protein
VAVDVTGPQGAVVNKACVLAQQSHEWHLPVSSTYNVAVTQVFDAKCLNPAAPALVLRATPINGVVLVSFDAHYTLEQGRIVAPAGN